MASNSTNCSRSLSLLSDSTLDDSGKISRKWRESLPSPVIPKADLSIWTILRQFVGKDLTRITIPVIFNEPLSFLQRLAEYMEYFELLEKAENCDDEVERFELVIAFIISSLSSNYLRFAKPFNPLLFETFELDRSNEEGYRFVAEQVSHHPPISAFHAQFRFGEFFGTVSPRVKFWGISIEILPCAKRKEIYTWDAVNISVHNIIMGEMYMKLNGQINVRCGLDKECKIILKNNYRERGIQNGFFEGSLCISGKIVRSLYGNWINFFATCHPKDFDKIYQSWLNVYRSCINTSDEEKLPLIKNSKLLWRCAPRPLNSANMYNFTSFSLLLNDPDYINDFLPRTDSRLRPDIRRLEQGEMDEAANQKGILEVKQREARVFSQKNGIIKQPRWFNESKAANGPSWIFNGKYWDRSFEDCEDIY
ncbi:unnamed protein product [Dracunculus medinensis]|uniref:Oxysterol-binding protein n=1 Tax=Dracunculus medinensis TaxID=318479 RepID=A0A0N4UI05_DRAME|nr:unnamed protein product [Dracunculus medinensis]